MAIYNIAGRKVYVPDGSEDKFMKAYPDAVMENQGENTALKAPEPSYEQTANSRGYDQTDQASQVYYQPRATENVVNKDTGSFLGDAYERIKAGAMDFLSKNQELLGKVAGTYNDAVNFSKGIKTNTASNNPMLDWSEANKRKAEELREASDRYNGKGFFDLAKNGEWGKAAGSAMLSGFESLPQSAAIMAATPFGLGGAMLADMGITSAMDRYKQLSNPSDGTPEWQKEQFKNMPEWKKIVDAGLYGVAEAGSEYLGNAATYRMIANAFKFGGKQAALDTAKKGFIDTMGKFMDKTWFISPAVVEGLEEVGNTYAQYATDKALGLDWTKGGDNEAGAVFKQAVDAFAGGFAGGTQFTAMAVPGHIKQWNDTRKVTNAYNNASKGIEGIFNEQEKAQFDETIHRFQQSKDIPNINTFLNNVYQAKGLNDNQRKAVLDYTNASMSYNSYVSYVNDRINDEVKRRMEDIDSNLNEDMGTVMQAVVNGDTENPVFVTKGKLYSGELDDNMNPTIDYDKSDDVIYYRDKDGKIQQCDVRNVSYIENEKTRANLYAEILDEVRTQVVNEEENDINFAPGDEVVLPDGNTGTIQSKMEDGSYTVVSNGMTNQYTADQLGKPNEQAEPEPEITAEERAATRTDYPTKNGKIDFDNINDPQMFHDGLLTEFGDDAESSVDECIANLDKELKSAGSMKDPIKKRRKIAEINQKLDFFNQVKSQFQPKEETTETLETSEPTVEQPVDTTQEQPAVNSEAPAQDAVIPYEDRPVDDTIYDLLDGQMDIDEVNQFVEANKKASDKALSEIEKKKPQVGTDRAEYLRQKSAWQAMMDDAKRKSDYWTEVKNGLDKGSITDAEQNTLNAYDKQVPLNAHELAARALANGSIKLLREDYQKETGGGNAEANKMFGIFASEQKGGVGIERAGEILTQMDHEAGTNFLDPDDPNAARDVIIDVLSQARTRGDLINYIRDQRQAQQRREEEAAYNDFAKFTTEAYGMTPEEYQAYEDDFMRNVSSFNAEVSSEVDGMIYDGIKQEIDDYNEVEQQLNNNEYGENEQGGVSEEGYGGGEILYGQPSVPVETGDRAVEETGQAVAYGDVQDEAPQGEAGGTGSGQLGEAKLVNSSYSVSDKKASNGEYFYQDQSGNIDLVNIPQEIFDAIGYSRAPIRLTPSMLDHFVKRHGKETKVTDEKQAIDFIIDVMNNFDHIRQGKDGALVFSIENGRNKTGRRSISILLSSDSGKFYGVVSSGYEGIQKLKNRPLLWGESAKETSPTNAASANVTTGQSSESGEQSGSASNQSDGQMEAYNRHTTDKQSAETVEVSQDKEQSGTDLTSSMITPTTSSGKDNINLSNKQAKQTELSENVLPLSDAAVKDSQKISESEQEVDTEELPYAITSYKYTTQKGKVLDMRLVSFDAPLTDEQKKIANKIAKEDKGWFDRKSSGYLMRSEDGARRLAEAVVKANNPDISKEDYNKDNQQDKNASESKDNLIPDNNKANGQKQGSSYGSKNKIVSNDRYEELKKRMRDKLNQLNVGIDPEMLQIGIEMAVYHIEAGAVKFTDFSKAMITDLGDKIRPYLKSFYNGARDLPEAVDAGLDQSMTPYDEVKRFDIVNFEKPGNTAMDIIEGVAKEQNVEQEAERIKNTADDQSAKLSIDDIKPGMRVILKDGRNVLVSVVMHSGEQVGALQFTKPRVDNLYIIYRGEMLNIFPGDVDMDATRRLMEKNEVITPVKEKTKQEKPNKSKKKAVALRKSNERSLFDNESTNDKEEVENGLQPIHELRPGGLPTDGIQPEQGLRGVESEVSQGAGQESRGINGVREGYSPDANRDRSEARLLNQRNNRSERGVDYAPKSVDARIEANIKAIELANELYDSGQQATPDQMAVLRRFSGWGGLGKAFQRDNPTSSKLRELLGDEAYEQANLSRNSAYYTPSYIIDSLWDIARNLGFKGGRVLEGSAGIGNIIGAMPKGMSDRSDIHAVEIDQTTGKILSLLYPDANVEIKGFESTKVENGSVDLAITNVPFVTGQHVIDDTGDKDLSRKFRNIHDFCIAKNVRKLREGGIGIFISSNGTLDNSQKLRNWVVNEGKSDFIGAFRLNKKTFGGTGVTSDIIIIRKRVNGVKSSNAIDVSQSDVERVEEYDTGETRKVKGKEERIIKSLPLDYNKYFMEHPENMAGVMRFGFEEKDTYHPTSKGLFPSKDKDQEQMLEDWVKSFAGMSESIKEIQTENPSSNTYEKLGKDVKEGSMLLNSAGKLCVASFGNAVPLDLNDNKIKGHTKNECFLAYRDVKRALSELMDYEANNEGDEGLNPLLDKLNRMFDRFVNTYGHLHKNTAISFLKNDIDFQGVLALEKYEEKSDENGKRYSSFEKTDVFRKRVIDHYKDPVFSNVKDGIVASIYKNGRIDVPYIASTLGRSEDEVSKEIINSGLGFEDPVSREIEVVYEYLSGNVREKLAKAKEENKDGRYDSNIKALEAKVPMNIPSHLIEFSIGSSWIDSKLYDDFVKEMTGVSVRSINAGGTWELRKQSPVETEKNRAMGVISAICHKTVLGHELIEAAMQNKTITVSETRKISYNGTTETITDKEATQACSNKIDEIRQQFKDWARERMQTDPDMANKIESIYNEKLNNYVPKSIPEEFIPDYFPGASKTFKMRPHQAKAIILGTTQPLLLAHEVGTGKTFTMISIAMEMRRLGTAKKPMIVVQNATTGQFVESAKALYPNAKVLSLSDKDHTLSGRQSFYAKIKYNDWDMIVIPQSVFERIPDSEERRMAFVKDKIDEKMAILEQMKKEDENSFIVKAAEREIEQLSDELSSIGAEIENKKKDRDAKKDALIKQNASVMAMEMLDREVDDVENFDDMGIDAILVDEAHEYKHLGFATAMKRGVKGVDPSYSKKAQGVYLKAQSVLERNNGKNVIFATGTPISNTAAEIWTFMRYLMPADVMKEYDIYYFDDFVRNFGNLQQMLEFATSGNFRENNRFAGYFNLPELVRIWSSVADTVRTEEAEGVKEKIPAMETGKAQDIYLPQTKALRSIMKYVKEELRKYDNMSGKEKKANSHIPLTMYGIAKAAAVDVRLVSEDAADDPNSKTNESVRQTLRSLKDSDKYKGTVALFADNYQNKKTGFNLYEDIKKKLVKAGVPADKIVIMRSDMTAKKKLEIFDKVNSGDIRVIMGSTFTLGTGVNIQERLHTLIHIDAPNRPMDYTQRNGRILRQGNIHKDMGIPVRVLRFGVEDSLDVTAYQRLKTKGAIAESIMRGKEMMKNSMENRSLEEDEDVFGDTVAQLSGSEYAMLKSQAEKEVRKLNAKKKQWEADQIYIHNAIPSMEGRIKEAEDRVRLNEDRLSKIKGNDGKIKVNGIIYDSVDGMAEFFKTHNKKQKEDETKIRERGTNEVIKRNLSMNIGGFDFEFTTTLSGEFRRDKGDLRFTVGRKATYSCPELDIENRYIEGGYIRNGVESIINDVISGEDFREWMETAKASSERMKEELGLLKSRKGKPFQFEKDLNDAIARLEDYTDRMKQELQDKEAKYQKMDSEVEAATGLSDAEEEDDVLYREGDDVFTDDLSTDEIVSRAKADGTYMKAPNGKPSKLTPRQWAQVRTKAFKDWFGDWEKSARIEKLRNSDSVSIKGDEIEITDDYKQNKRNALEYGKKLRATYVNKDTGVSITLGKSGVKEVLNHDYKDKEQIQSIAAIPQIIENSIYIESANNEDTDVNKDVSRYHYYVCGLNIGGVDYTVRAVIAEQPNGDRYYDHKLTRIEKGKLLDSLSGIPTPGFNQGISLVSDSKDKRLSSILQTNSSKVVDENGEPIVVYHGTDKDITSFEMNDGSMGRGVYFTSNWDEAAEYAMDKQGIDNIDDVDESKIYECFVDVRDDNQITHSRFSSEDIEVLVTDPTQIKSATDNVGAFDGANPDIRYREGDNLDDIESVNERFNERLDELVDNPNQKDRILHLGNSSKFLQEGGISDAEIILEYDKLVRKSVESYKNRHPYSIEDIKDLPKAINSPIAVFVNTNGNNDHVILTELKKDGKNFIVAIKTSRQNRKGGVILTVNEIVTLFPKDEKGIINWINTGKATNIDKEKALRFIEALPNHPGTTITSEELDSATKVVKDFVNPTLYDGNIEEESALLRPVTDEETLDRLNNEETIKVYRAMQVIDGKLYPPMSAKVGGKLREPINIDEWEEAEERPDLATEDGKFVLNKGNGSSLKAAYNPYIHTSRSPLNDQFSSAQDRDNLVVVEVEIPKSELTSGYKAYKAKDPVGEMTWHSGPVSSKLKGEKARKVILTRWDKPVRIVPDTEVAKRIAKLLEGEDIIMPSNVVTPSLRAELEKLGVPFIETDNRGKPILNREGEGSVSDTTYRQRMRDEAENMGRALGVEVEIVDDGSTLPGKKGKAKGFFDRATKKVTVVVGNHKSIGDIQATVLHEVVGHYGLRGLLGESFDDMMDIVYRTIDKVTRKKIAEAAIRKHRGDVRVATEEYLASVAERGVDRPGVWSRIKSAIKAFFRSKGIDLRMSDEDIAYLLWKSKNRLMDGDSVPTIIDKVAKDQEMREELLYRDGLGFGSLLHTPKKDRKGLSDIAHDVMEKIRNGNPFTHENFIRLQEGYQDRLIRLREFQDKVAKETGHDVKDFEDMYTFENQAHSRAQQDIEDFLRDIMEPVWKLHDEIARTINKPAGENIREIETYLMARHGLERNAVMRDKEIQRLQDEAAKRILDLDKKRPDYQDRVDEINDKLNDQVSKVKVRDFSGLTAISEEITGNPGMDEKACEKYAKDFESKHDTDKLWKAINKATGSTLDKLLETGQITKELYSQIKGMYKYYIPLKEWDGVRATDMYDYVEPDQDIVSNPLKQAKGRKTRAGNVLANIASDYESATMLGYKNLCKLRLLNLARNSGTGELSVSEQWYTKGYDANGNEIWEPASATGFTEDAAHNAQVIQDFNDNMRALQKSGDALLHKDVLRLGVPVKKWQEKQHTVRVKEAGKEILIYFNGDPRVAQAINGQNNVKLDNAILRVANRLRKWMMLNYTARNINFILRNFMRDFFYVNTMNFVKYGAVFEAKYFTNFPKAFAEICAVEFKGRKVPEYESFRKNGGMTGYVEVMGYDRYKNEIERLVKKSERAGNRAVNLAYKFGDVFHAIGSYIECFNSVIENCSRYTVYKTAKQTGMSELKAIEAAKEASVNCNRRGSGQMGAVWAQNAYFFFNASIQGTQNFVSAANNNRARAAMALGFWVALGYTMRMIGAALSGDDDDSYDNLPDYVRQNNLVFYVPGTGNKYIMLPLPVELRAIFGLGDMLGQASLGQYKGRDFAGDLALKLTDLLPKSVEFPDRKRNDDESVVESVAKNFSPDAIRPLLDAYWFNENYFGKRVTGRNAYNKHVPEWQKVSHGTSKTIINASRIMNELTGGDYATKGWSDSMLTNPSALEYLFEQYLGGVGKVLTQSYKSVEGVVNGDLAMSNVPVVSGLTYSTENMIPRNYTNERYRNYIDEYEETASRMRKYKEGMMGGEDLSDAFNSFTNSDAFRRYMLIGVFKKQIDNLYDMAKTVGSDSEEAKNLNRYARELKGQMINEIDKLDENEK